MSIFRIYTVAAATTVLAFSATPAFAGFSSTPGPLAGVGIGALAVVAVGYRALKRRMGE